MLFPQLGPQYYTERHKGLLARMEAFYSESITLNQSAWVESDTDLRFFSGDQTLWNDLYGNVPTNRRRQFTFNRIRPIINMIGGHQRKNRKSTIVVPVENADAETADQFSKIMLWISQREGMLETISESFEGGLVTGMNLLHVWMDYRSDPISGNIRIDNTPYNAFLIDPYFKKTDLSDCNGIWKRSFLTRRECISLMPDRAEEIAGLQNNDSGTGKDGKFQFMSESYSFSYKNLLTYDEFYYRDFRTQKMLADTQTGETMEWKSNDEEGLRSFLKAYPQVTIIEQEIQTVNVAIVIQGKVFYDGPQPSGLDSYPFVPVFAYYHPEMPYFPWRVQGVVRGLRDAQYLYNRRRIIELDTLESQLNSGYIVKEDALVNPKDPYTQIGQGKVLTLKQEAQMTDIQIIQSPAIPASTIQLSELLGKELNAVSGINEENLGAAIDDKAGILAMLRASAGVTTLQILFDNLDRAQKLLGHLIIDLIQTNFTPGKVKKILEGKEPSPQFYNKAFGKYGAAVEEGINTTTQKQMQFGQMMYLKEAGVHIPDESLIEAATLQNKPELLKAIQAQKEQAAQAQQMQMQAAIQEQQARTELAKARAQADQGLGMERISRIQENQALAVERQAAAKKDEEIGLLNLVKALKEIDSVDLEQLEKLISLSNLMGQSPKTETNIPTATVA